jgi:hypothetical protein
MTHYQMRRHPVAAFLTLLILGPYLLAAALIIVVLYLIATAFLMLCGRR